MLIRMLANIASVDGSLRVGQVVDSQDLRAADWIEAGFAEPYIAPQPKVAPVVVPVEVAPAIEAEPVTVDVFIPPTLPAPPEPEASTDEPAIDDAPAPSRRGRRR